MNEITKKELLQRISETPAGVRADVREVILRDMDLSDCSLKNIDFTGADFQNVRLEGTDLSGSIFVNSYFSNCSLKGACLDHAILISADLRGCNLVNVSIYGANLFCAQLEGAALDGIRSDEKTKYYRIYCPETGAFLAYKKCFGYRMVRLLIPADAKRCSGTTNACRCDKAKVLKIESIDYKTTYDEANSFVDENFIYQTGKMIHAVGFHEDRWAESSGGIHFFMTREEALGYL